MGLPIDADEAPSSLDDLRELFGWPNDPDKCADEANKLIRRLLEVFPDDNVAPAAKILFGETRRSAETLQERRLLAAEKLNIEINAFITNFEPYILNTIAEQLLQLIAQPDQKPEDRARAYLAPKIGSIVALLLLGLAASQNWFHVKHTFITEGQIRLAALSAAVLTMILVAILSVWRHARDELPSPTDYQIQPLLDPDILATTQKAAAQHLSHSKMAIPLLVDMILSPSKYRMRIIESISLVGRSIKQQVKLEFTFSDVRSFLTSSLSNKAAEISEGDGAVVLERPHLATPGNVRTAEITARSNTLKRLEDGLEHDREVPELIYVPVLVPLKGELIDYLQIYRSNGTVAASLSHTQSLRLLSLGLRYLLVAALVNPKNYVDLIKDSEFTDLLKDPKFIEAELGLLQLISRRGPVDQYADALQRAEGGLDQPLVNLDDILEELENLYKEAGVPDVERTRGLADVRRYVEKLVYCYPIIVDLPNNAQPRRHLQYERVIVPRPLGTSRLRLWLGLRPDRVQIPISLAFEADSYHLEVVGPVEHYVEEQFVGCRGCRRRIRSDWRGVPSSRENCHHAPIGSDERCYIRLRRRVGQNYCHVYMRGFAASHLLDSEMVAEIKFAEAPPGVEERALLTAFALSVVLTVVAYLRSRTSGDLYSDIPVVLLTVPGVAATWFGFSSDGDTVLRSSLTARLSLVVTGLLSLAAIACYLIQPHTEWTTGPRWEFLGIHQWLWLILLWASLINLAWMSYKTAARMLQFIWLSGRRRFTMGHRPGILRKRK